MAFTLDMFPRNQTIPFFLIARQKPALPTRTFSFVQSMFPLFNPGKIAWHVPMVYFRRRTIIT